MFFPITRSLMSLPLTWQKKAWCLALGGCSWILGKWVPNSRRVGIQQPLSLSFQISKIGTIMTSAAGWEGPSLFIQGFSKHGPQDNFWLSVDEHGLMWALMHMFQCLVNYSRKLSTEELMLLDCGVGEDSWNSLGLQGEPTNLSQRSVLGVHWKD